MRYYEVRVLNLTTNQRIVKYFETRYEMEKFILEQKEKHPIHKIHNGAPLNAPYEYYFFFREE